MPARARGARSHPNASTPAWPAGRLRMGLLARACAQLLAWPSAEERTTHPHPPPSTLAGPARGGYRVRGTAQLGGAGVCSCRLIAPAWPTSSPQLLPFPFPPNPPACLLPVWPYWPFADRLPHGRPRLVFSFPMAWRSRCPPAVWCCHPGAASLVAGPITPPHPDWPAPSLPPPPPFSPNPTTPPSRARWRRWPRRGSWRHWSATAARWAGAACVDGVGGT